MKTLIKAALAATVATGLFAAPAFAAPNADNEDFTATATIVKPVVLTKGTDLDFGTITLGATLGTAVVGVSQAGAVDCDGNSNAVVCTGAAKAATFTLTGVGGQKLDIDFGTPPTALVSSTDSVPFALDSQSTITLLANGTGAFGVGGNITVKSTTDDGVYSADLNVTVTYQ